MAVPQHFTQVFIKIKQTAIPTALMDALDEIVVDTSLHWPDMFTIQFQDPQFEWIDSDLFELGNTVEISVQTGEEQGGLKGTLIKGEITTLEPYFSAQGRTTLLVRGYDKSHRLHRGKKTRTFLKQSDSELAKKIAAEVGLTPEVDNTNIRYDYIIQNNQTNMEFLLARAERIGYQVFAVEGKLYFKKGEATQGDGPELRLGETLTSFRPTLTTSHQADKIVVKGWDPKGKQPITSQLPPDSNLNQGGMQQTGGNTAKSVFDSAEAVVVNRPIFTVDEAQALATGLSQDINREFIQAEGQCNGDPRLKAGWHVTLKGIGQRFSGKYFVTSATHIYSPRGYDTTFTISGRHPNSVTHLLNRDNGAGQAVELMQGVVTALVTNVNDPDNLGRVKVKYVWLGDIESDWIRIATPMAGSGRGFFYLPEINDEVLLAFEHGDVHRPYLIGVLWNAKDKPPEPNSEVASGGKINRRVLKSRSGHLVVLDDTDGQEQIVIRDKTGSNELVIDSKQNSMTIKVAGNFTVEAKGKISLNSMQDLSLDSKANGNLKTMGNMSLEATGTGTVKAATVSVQGQALAEIKAGLIKLN
ncbi:MAG: VgrG-related protein [Anaerolineaceae bacterium]|nr:VgrG-related protein [Anaerolineaceae bacterium]